MADLIFNGLNSLDFAPGDSEQVILRKILGRLKDIDLAIGGTNDALILAQLTTLNATASSELSQLITLNVTTTAELAQLVAANAELVIINASILAGNALLTAGNALQTTGNATLVSSLTQQTTANTNLTTINATLVSTSATTAAALVTANATLAATLALSTTSTPVSNPLFQADLFGTINSRASTVFFIKGRRAGFNTININQDIGEFLGTTIDLFPEMTGAEVLEVVSSSASDTAAGVGTRTIKITYLNNSNAIVQSADITMNGVTPVAVGFTAVAILWMAATTGGTSETTVGTITLRVVAGITHEQITPGNNRSLSSRFMVPAGHTAYIPYWKLTAIGGATQDTRLRAKVNEFTRAAQNRYSSQANAFIDGSVTSVVINDLPWLRFPALCKIKGSTISSATGAANRIDSTFTVLLIAD